MNYIQSKLEDSLCDRLVDISLNEADNEFLEISIEFSFNRRFTSEIPFVYDEPILNNTINAICAAFEAISKKTNEDFYFIRPRLIFRHYPEITILGKIKVRKKEEEKMDKKIKKIIKKEKGLEKSTKSLLKEDIKHDKKLDKCDMMMAKKKHKK